jgi:hypothetical protein
VSGRGPHLDVTEADFQRLVLDLLHVTGWEVMHVRRSIGRRGGTAAWQTTTSIAGWPDFAILR